MPDSVTLVPDHLRGLVDDAAVFPPGNAPLDQALDEHLRHRAAAYADLVGPFVVGDADVPRLAERAAVEPLVATLAVHVVVSGGAGALEPAVRWATRSDRLELRAVEIALRESDAGDLAPNARRVVAAVDSLVAAGLLEEGVTVFVEPPRLHGADPSPAWLGALDEVAAADHCLKLRTGGVDPDAFPEPRELATCIGAALDRELRFKCTAGLHHAVRHHDPATGVEHHGFLNVLVATRAALDGAGADEVAGVLDEQDAATLLRSTAPEGLRSARRWFTSFGSCSVLDPLHDLVALGLVQDPA